MDNTVQSVDFKEIREGMEFVKEYQITPEVYEGFVNTFGDKNRLHTDDDYAASNGFNAKVMQGAILNGFVSHFIGMEFPYKNTIIQSVNIEFKQPNYLGDQLKLEAVVDQKSEAVQTVILKMTIINVTRRYVAAKAKVQIGRLEGQA